MNIKSLFSECDKVYIYGAGSRARSLYQYIGKCTNGCKIQGFLVSSRAENPREVLGQRVYAAEETEPLDKTITVLIGARTEHHDDIIVWLRQQGFERIIPVTPQMENDFRLEYIRQYYTRHGKDFILLKDAVYDTVKERLYLPGNNPGIAIYMVQSAWDSAKRQMEYPGWIVPIQAGASLTEKRICKDTDNIGENISEKNRKYSELTAIYWVWKHVQAPYIGICHYRRHFLITDDMLRRLELAGADVILPVPAVAFPDVATDYKLRHGEEKWNIMLEVLREEYPQYCDAAEEEFAQECYFGCNMWIMRHDIMDKFLSWLFAILEKIEQRAEESSGTVGNDVYQNRYIGFLSERLTGVFFRYHEKEWKIMYAEKMFFGE